MSVVSQKIYNWMKSSIAKKSGGNKEKAKRMLKAIAYFASVENSKFREKSLGSLKNLAKRTNKNAMKSKVRKAYMSEYNSKYRKSQKARAFAKKTKRGVASEVRSARGSRYAKRIYR